MEKKQHHEFRPSSEPNLGQKEAEAEKAEKRQADERAPGKTAGQSPSDIMKKHRQVRP